MLPSGSSGGLGMLRQLRHQVRDACLGLRVRARALNWLLACRARTTVPPCSPVAPITAINCLSLDDIIHFSIAPSRSGEASRASTRVSLFPRLTHSATADPLF